MRYRRDYVAEQLKSLLKKQIAMDPVDFKFVEEPLGTMRCPYTHLMCINEDNSCYCCSESPEYAEYEAMMDARIAAQEKEDYARARKSSDLAWRLCRDHHAIPLEDLIHEFRFVAERLDDMEQNVYFLKLDIKDLEDELHGKRK